MKKLSIFIFSLSLFGCAMTPVEQSLDEQHVTAIRSAKVYVFIPQDKVFSTVIHADAGSQFGPIGGIMDNYETAKRYRKMLQTVKPIQDITSDMNFRRDYIAALKNSGIFRNANHIELVTKVPQSREERFVLAKSANGRPVVMIDVEYLFDISYKMLLVSNRLELWQKTEERPVHYLTTLYQSHPVSQSNSHHTWEKAVKIWSKNRGSRYRQYHRQGIRESMHMLKSAVLRRPSSLPLPEKEPYVFTDYRDRYHHKNKGKILKSADNRAMVIDKHGNYYSVSTGPTYVSARRTLSRPPAGKGRVFFYRAAKKDVKFIEPDILLNNKEIGQFVHGTFLYKDLRPGTYTVSLAYTGKDPTASLARNKMSNVMPVKLNIKPGLYYLRLDGYRGIFTKEDALKVIEPSIAKQEIGPLLLNK